MRNALKACMVFIVGCCFLLVGAQIPTTTPPQLPEFGSWCPPQYIPEILLEIQPGYPTDIAEADLDGDGQVEILLATQEVVGESGDWTSYLFRITDPLAGDDAVIEQLAIVSGAEMEWGATGLRQGFVSQIAVEDVNQDGLDDVVVVAQNATSNPDVYISKLMIVLGNATGEFEKLEFPLELGLFTFGTILVADIDDDNRVDAVIPDPLNQKLLLLGGFEQTQFTVTSELTMPEWGHAPSTVICSDIDNDGHLDLVIGGFALQDSGTVRRFIYIAYRQEDETFKISLPLYVGWEEPTLLDISIATADVDRNGWVDILATVRSDVEKGLTAMTPSWPEAETFVILSQREPGVFYTRLPSWFAEGGPTKIALLDVDSSAMKVLFHIPGIGFQLYEEFSRGSGRDCSVFIARSEAGLVTDIDGDGWLEMIFAARKGVNSTALWTSNPRQQEPAK